MTLGISDKEVIIDVGDLRFVARLETELAPKSCEAIRRLLPLTGHLLQARWSGEAAWMPLGDLDLGIGVENPASRPAPGQLLLYPKGISETEILLPYGQTAFASKFGALVGNRCLTIVEGMDQLSELGWRVVWKGAQPIRLAGGLAGGLPPAPTP
jgi:hypothetical protein